MVDQSVDKASCMFSSARIEMQYNSLRWILKNQINHRQLLNTTDR